MLHYLALCALGAEKILGNELKQFGYALIKSYPGRVIFEATETAMYQANIALRTADRVYLLLSEFPATDFDIFFAGVKKIDWQDYFYKDVRVVIDKVRIHASKINSEHTVQAMAHKAIYTKLGEKWKMRNLPESGKEICIRIYIDHDTALILLDLSGVPLHKRGYRTSSVEAPLRETTAASLLQIVCWRRKTPLHDPFCGSGTIAIEAALYAYNVAPGLGRSFAFENLSIFDQAVFQEIRLQEAAKIRSDCLARITGTDKDEKAVLCAQHNAENACAMAGRALQLIGSDMRLQRPDFEVADFSDLQAPYEKGLLLTNPPYGERLGDTQSTEKLYNDMKILQKSFCSWQMGLITACKTFENLFEKKADQVRKIKSGNLDTQFFQFNAL